MIEQRSARKASHLCTLVIMIDYKRNALRAMNIHIELNISEMSMFLSFASRIFSSQCFYLVLSADIKIIF